MNFHRTHKRWFVGAFVVAVLSLVVCLIGPLLGSEENRPFAPWSVRLLLVLLIVAMWLGGEAAAVWLNQRRNKRMMDALASKDKADSDAIHNLFNEAMATLKRTRLGGQSGARLLYQLPWYVFIGEPGSGKTTALINSGLRFPLAPAGAAAEALGGHRWYAQLPLVVQRRGSADRHSGPLRRARQQCAGG